MKTYQFDRSPCLTCGACCAVFRVSFYWREVNDTPDGTVPLELTQDLTGHLRCMAGTNQSDPRCVALIGSVGAAVRCAIYEQRPSPCREFGVAWHDGMLVLEPDDLARCNVARERWHLPPLELPAPHETTTPNTPADPLPTVA